MFRKIGIVFLVVLFMLTLASCGAKEKVNDKITEKVTEGIVNKATGADADIDLKDGKITVKGEDGEKVTIGETKWPEGFAAGKMPEFKGGKIMTSAVTDKTLMVIIEEVELKDYEEYVGKIKENFVDNASEINSSDFHAYSASSDEAVVYLQYGLEGKTLTISMEIQE